MLALVVTVALVTPAAIFTLAQAAGAVVNQINTVAGDGDFTYNGDGIAATESAVDDPQSVVADPGGNLLIADTLHNRVRVVAKSAANPGYPLAGCSGSCTWTVGDIFTVAGTGTAGYNNDGISATTAQLNIPDAVAVDAQGNVVIADSSNTRIRVVAVGSNPGYVLAGCGGSCTWTTGDIFTVAGTGATAYNGDGIAATSADFGAVGVSVDTQGNLVIADTLNNRVRVVAVGTNPGYPLSGCSGSCTWTDGDAFTITGTGTGSYNGDGISAGTAEVFQPNSAVTDANGNVVIGDGSNTRVRVVSVGANPGYPLSGCGGSCTWTNGDIFTIAGTGTGGYNGDGIAAGTAKLGNPPGVALDPQGNVLIADTSNNRVRAVAVSVGNPGYALRDADCPGGTCTWAAGDIFTVAGDGAFGYTGDGLTSTSAGVFLPGGVAVDASGNLLIADSENERIRNVLVGPALAGFTVPANVGDPNGYDTGYSANNSVTLTASGTWDAGAGSFGPDGDSSLNPAGSGYLEPTVTGTALVGRVGTSGAWTKIGTGPTTLNGIGELYLAMNDQLGAYGDNTGSVTVAIAAEINIWSGYQGDGPVLAGTDVPWQGFVTNTGASTLTNVSLLLLPGADTAGTPHFQEFDSGFSPIGTSTQCSAVTPAFVCTVGSFAPGDSIEVDIDAIDTHGMAPQTLSDFFALLSSQTGGIFSATAPISSTATQEVDGLRIHVNAPATVQEGTTLTISGYVENTSATDDITQIATFSQIDKGTVTGSTLCAFQNNSPTGASDRCPTAGTFTQPAATDGSATPASVDINTNGLAGQTIHYTTVATSPDLGGNSEVVSGSVFVTPTPGNIVVTDPTSGSTWAGSATHSLTAFPVPSSGHAVTSVDFWDGPPHQTGSTLLANVAAPGPYTTAIPGGTLSSGLHVFYAEMHQDDAGATDFFNGASVTVVGPPTVSIVPPSGFASGGSLNTAKTFTATAHASAPSTLTSVVWQIDGLTTVPSAATAPYTATVNPASLELSAGSHSLTATATDSTGQSATSAAFNFTVPAAALSIPTVTTVATSVTPGGDAAWTVEVDNTSGSNIAHHVTVTLNATATDSMSTTTDLSFDTASMNGALHVPPATPTCHAGAGDSVVCNVGELGAGAGVLFPVFVHTDGISTGSTITGTAVGSAANANDTAPKPLGAVSVASCGSVCVQSVVAAGTTFDGDPARLHTTGQVLRLSSGLQSVAHGVKFGKPFRLGTVGPRHGRVTFRPRLDSTPSVKVQLNSYAPSASTDPIDAHLCPTPTACVGEISEVSGGFTLLTSTTNPIMVTIIAKWGATVPGTGMWMQKPAVGSGPIPNPIHLAACTINATTRAFNTPCILPEIVKTLTVGSTTTKTTYDTILFTGNDPHFCRR